MTPKRKNTPPTSKPTSKPTSRTIKTPTKIKTTTIKSKTVRAQTPRATTRPKTGKRSTSSGRSKRPKRRKKGRRAGNTANLMRVYRLSPMLSQLLDKTALSRSQAIKLIWKYIKDHDLNDGHVIACDKALRTCFDTDYLHFFSLTAYLTPHLLEVVDTLEEHAPSTVDILLNDLPELRDLSGEHLHCDGSTDSDDESADLEADDLVDDDAPDDDDDDKPIKSEPAVKSDSNISEPNRGTNRHHTRARTPTRSPNRTPPKSAPSKISTPSSNKPESASRPLLQTKLQAVKSEIKIKPEPQLSQAATSRVQFTPARSTSRASTPGPRAHSKSSSDLKEEALP
ncbi:SWIB/MDM2 domain protein [Gregarina niphandrodes]|uniref:SWIB/MDM2 domain protein n=1 Tax=Gregarina niphandrodes TaxID=110365 RepID=A0A023B735_GRENI|nr:SWIB/MDM2 domain protein [Gregarina niphandrodes]EZG67003.1 SWIB/MDM2 domain protein [Gregarina niphandrodes]|eukprot:XP_011130390.1 SWIB/MDM2 domain protein [Gregarina niphandrodes]